MNDSEHLNYVSQIVTAYVARNDISHESIPAFIEKVSSTLKKCLIPDGMTTVAATTTPPLPPGVDINETVFPDYIICLEDGNRYQTLKRHLSVLGMSPDDYRRKWNLPTDYPMVCETYSARRSELAVAAKLGAKPTPVPEPKKAQKAAGKSAQKNSASTTKTAKRK
jgi:predicted transcriptional regulator